MYFSIEPTNQLIQGKLILYPDTSFGIENSKAWDFQISIKSYPVLCLNVNRTTGQCVGIEGVLCHDKRIRKTIYKTISINDSKIGILKVSDIDTDDDLVGVPYQLKNTQEYYDKENRIFAIGEIDCNGELWHIGKGQYVRINNGQLIAIYIYFNS